MQALGSTEHSSEGLDSGAGDVQLGLLSGEGDTGGLRVESALHRAGVLSAVAVAHPTGPDAPSRAVLGDLLEEIDVSVEEETESGGEDVDWETGGECEFDVGEPVGESEGEFFNRRRAGLANVVSRDRHRMPPRHLGRGEGDRVAHESHRLPRREDELFLRLVLLQNVVLQGPAEASTRNARPLRLGDEHREDHRGRRVDRHGGGDLAEIDVGVEVLHIGEGVDRDTATSHLAKRHRVVGVDAEEGRHVESR